MHSECDRSVTLGTGKTKTLAHRVARLILGGADPHRLLLLTLTRRAALEMTRRAQQILVASRRGPPSGGAEAALLPWSGTFHSIGNRLLRRHATALSLDPAFTVLDRADSTGPGAADRSALVNLDPAVGADSAGFRYAAIRRALVAADGPFGRGAGVSPARGQ